jgi:hypothetical protein
VGAIRPSPSWCSSMRSRWLPEWLPAAEAMPTASSPMRNVDYKVVFGMFGGRPASHSAPSSAAPVIGRRLERYTFRCGRRLTVGKRRASSVVQRLPRPRRAPGRGVRLAGGLWPPICGAQCRTSTRSCIRSCEASVARPSRRDHRRALTQAVGTVLHPGLPKCRRAAKYRLSTSPSPGGPAKMTSSHTLTY